MDSNWSTSKIAQALLLDENTIRNYKDRCLSGGLEQLCNDAYQGPPCTLDKNVVKLEKELRANIYLCTKEVIAYVKADFKIEYSVSGMTNLLHRIGFSYKKPDIVPGKADAKKQKEFLELYEQVKS